LLLGVDEGTMASDSFNPTESLVGKGDKRTFRGKVFKGSHGKTRPSRPKKKAKKRA
jgi:ribosomal small subunit protein bTHX